MKIKPRKISYVLGQTVWFFNFTDLDVNEGIVIGAFLMPGEPKENKYAFQIEYEKEGEKVPQVASLEDANISDSKEGIIAKFRPYRKKRINDEIGQADKDLKEIKEKFTVGEGIKKAIEEKLVKLKKMKEEEAKK